MVDGTVCDLGHAQDRGGDGAGCSKCRAQIRGWRRRLPLGTLAAMSVRKRLEARRRIERLLDEDRRRVAPPPEKAMTLVGWLDHERRCCSLEGATTTSSFGSVDDERRRTVGRCKPILDRKKRKPATANEPWIHSRGTPSGAPPPPLSLPRGQHGQKKERAAGAASCDSGAAACPPLM